MKIHLVSDLHLDHWSGKPFRPECDDESNTVLVLAGDIIGWTNGNYKSAVAWCSDVIIRYKHTIWVAGNHEFYDTSWEGAHHIRTNIELALASLCGVTGHTFSVSEEFDIFTLDGQRFLCGTGWIPEPDPGTPNITDARLIKRYKPEVFRRHKVFCDGLEANLKSTDIVVAHHLPSEKSIAPQYKGDIYNAWFCAPKLEGVILNRQPRLWCHGHTHNPFRYHIGSTEVVCNPKGYPGEGCARFNSNLVIYV